MLLASFKYDILTGGDVIVAGVKGGEGPPATILSWGANSDKYGIPYYSGRIIYSVK